MSWTFVDSDGAQDSASSTTIATPGVTVNAGDLAIVHVKFEGSTTTASCSDGTSSLTQWTKGVTGTASGEPFHCVFYILASVATGTNSVVYTVTLGASSPFREINVMIWTPSAAASVDGTANDNSGTTGTAATSGNITTTSTDGLAISSYGSYGEDVDVASINGVSVTRSVDAVGGVDITQNAGPSTHSMLMSIQYAAGFTGQAAATLENNERWLLGLIAFGIGGGGGETITMDKWFSPSKDPMRRKVGVVASGTIGIKS